MRRLVPFVLVGILAAGTGAAIGVGLAAAPTDRGPITPAEIMARPELFMRFGAAMRDDKNGAPPLPFVTTVRCDLPHHWVAGHAFTCVVLTALVTPQGTYTVTEGAHNSVEAVVGVFYVSAITW